MSLTKNKITTNASAVFSEMSATASAHVLVKKQQKRTSHSKPSRTIPVRQTLTSRLRMINAASIVCSDKASDKADTRQFSRAAKPPVRRPEFQKAVANGKQSSDFTGTFSERMATVKKSRAFYQQRNKERRHSKENKPPHIRISQEFRVLNIESGCVSSKLNHKNAVDKCDKPKIIYKKNALLNRNINKYVCTTIKNNQLQPWDKTPFKCNHSGNYVKSGRKTPSKTNVLSNKKRRLCNVAKEDKNSFESFHIQITKSVKRSCPITTEGNEAEDELPKAQRRSKEVVVVSTSDDQFLHRHFFQDRNNAPVAFNSRPRNTPSKAPYVSASIYSDSIKRVEEWLTGGKSKHGCHLHNSVLYQKHTGHDSKTDETTINTEKAVASESADSMNSFSSYRKKCYDEKCMRRQAATVNIKENELLNNPHPKTFTHSSNVHDERDANLAVSKSRPCVKDLTKYWEYLTALEKANSDFSDEVNSYGQAILSGADVQLVERNLRDLEGRFRSLRMSWRGENSLTA